MQQSKQAYSHLGYRLPIGVTHRPDATTYQQYLTTFERVCDEWDVKNDSRATLLDVSSRTFYRWRHKSELATLSNDQRKRISLLANIYVDLHIVFDENAALANAWVRRPNTAFSARAPLDLLLARSLLEFQAVFLYLRQVARR